MAPTRTDFSITTNDAGLAAPNPARLTKEQVLNAIAGFLVFVTALAFLAAIDTVLGADFGGLVVIGIRG